MNGTKLPTLVSWLSDDHRPHLMFLRSPETKARRDFSFS
jgi:hypothetical protein